MSIWIIFKLLGSLALLMFGMKAMSESLQKMAGPQLRHVLGDMTTNRFTGMLTGMLVTASVLSSTATTVMTVSFVNAGLITLTQAISVIMGANIGTTLTGWVMSAGLSFDITPAVYPAFFIGIILIYMKRHRYVGDFLFGVSFLLLGLGTLRAAGSDMDMSEHQTLLSFFSFFDAKSIFTTLLFLLLGGLATFCVQSSAAVMAIAMIFCSSGVLPIYEGVALVMGGNIGTTVTSNIAALSANPPARRTALAHMFFNVFGVVWMLFVFRHFVDMVCGWMGYDTTMSSATAAPAAVMANASKLNFVLAAFHTTFNVINTLILIWFIPLIERFVCWAISPKSDDEEEDFRLHFITAGFMKTPELSVLEAQKEISSFSERMQRMFGMVMDLLRISSSSAKKNVSEAEFMKLYKRIEKYEGISDSMELEIAKYLDSVSDAHLSDDTKAKIRAMLREITELESIGDACFNMARTIHRKYKRQQEHFTEKQYEHIQQMMGLANQLLTEMNHLMGGRKDAYDVHRTFNIEREINEYRTQLKSQNIIDINNHEYNYAVGTIYMDLINECERLGDYVVNVVEARTGTRLKE